MDGGGMVFEESGEVRPGTEEAWDFVVVLCEDLDDCWQTEDRLVVLITESFNGWGTGIIGDENSFFF